MEYVGFCRTVRSCRVGWYWSVAVWAGDVSTIKVGPNAARSSAAESKEGKGILEANYKSPPHVPGGSPTPLVSPRIPYLPLTHTPANNRSRFGLHPCLKGRSQVGAVGNGPECRGA